MRGEGQTGSEIPAAIALRLRVRIVVSRLLLLLRVLRVMCLRL